jgi:hypothetical protein
VVEERKQFLQALRRLDVTLDENADRAERMKERIELLSTACEAGQPLREFVPKEQTPLLVQLLTQSAQALDRVGSHVRITEARVLHHEGMTMDQIAALFGVSRQRVSVLLRG